MHSPIAIIANKEFKDSLRNKWIVSIIITLASLAFILSFLAIGQKALLKVSTLDVALSNIATLGVYFIPLIALLLAHNTIVGEQEKGSLLLMLTYPLKRYQFVLGKYLGQLAVLVVAIFVGFCIGLSPLYQGFEVGQVQQAVQSFATVLSISVVLGAVFLSVGTFISVVSKDSNMALGISLITWLFFIIIYDFALVAVVTTVKDVFSNSALEYLILFNPVDAFRVLAISLSPAVSHADEMLNISQKLGIEIMALVVSLASWASLPLIITTYIFTKKEL